MGIQRYSASLDTTITNAYEMNLTTRATGSNMGLADTLEVFSIYGQASRTSSELSRILIQFPVVDIAADRTNSVIPASGSVNFFLRMYNAEHAYTLPKDFSLNISAVSSSWEEGYGLDMDEYSDLTYDDVGANWASNKSGSAGSTATITALSKTAGQANTRVLTIVDVEGNSVSFTIDNSISTSTATKIAFGNANSNATQFATNVAAAINAADTANTLNVSATSDGAVVTCTMLTKGLAGDLVADMAGTAVSDSVVTMTKQWNSGAGNWASTGGDYYSDTSSSFSASFLDGTENIETDITTLVEQWLTSSNLGTKLNRGIEIMFPSSEENAARSYYTKKFFARGSQYFLKRPAIEARWDSSKKDESGNFFLSSSLVSAADNLNTLYVYNNFRGQLRDLPDSGSYVTGSILLSLYSGSADNSAPTGNKYTLPRGGGVAAKLDTNVTGTWVSTGIYSASFAYDGAATTIFPVWHRATNVSTVLEYHTGSAITVKTFDSVDYNPHPSYVTKITNLRDSYSRNEKKTRFRLYVREKDWNPNNYTKATSNVPTTIIEDAFYRIYRTTDEFEVVAYGTGSTNHTRLSYDTSGSYFDFPVDILETGYMYAFRFLYKMPDGNYREQPEIFKFRID
jgi:hypothetical protein